MKRLLFLLLLPISLFSLDVDISILKETEGFLIEFENYVGPYLFYNSVSDIRNIGTALADDITPGEKGDSDYAGKYKMFHSPSLEWEKVRTCDVFNITETALIDNINNVELILSQYLIDQYGYSLEDADLLARLLTIYNAVYRGNEEHYLNTYTSESAKLENSEHLGIDTKYYNWPGKTYLYIPLAENIISGDLSNIDSDLFIEDDVIDHIKDTSDDSIELREEIIEFKERQIDEKVEQLDMELEVMELELEVLEDQLEEMELEQMDLEPMPLEDELQVKELEENIEELQAEIEEVKEEKEELKKTEEKVLDLRDDVAVDKNQEIEEKVELKSAVLFLKNSSVRGTKMGQFLKLSDDGDVVASSNLNSVRESNFVIVRDNIYAIAGDEGDNHIISLASVDLATLKNLLTSKTPCYINSPILDIGNFIYAVIPVDGQYYLGEFNKDLNFIRKSPISFDKDSYIGYKDKRFYVQGTDNSIKWVNLSDFVSN